MIKDLFLNSFIKTFIFENYGKKLIYAWNLNIAKKLYHIKSFFAAIYDCFQYSNYFLNLTTFRVIFSKYYDNFLTLVHENYYIIVIYELKKSREYLKIDDKNYHHKKLSILSYLIYTIQNYNKMKIIMKLSLN